MPCGVRWGLCQEAVPPTSLKQELASHALWSALDAELTNSLSICHTPVVTQKVDIPTHLPLVLRARFYGTSGSNPS